MGLHSTLHSTTNYSSPFIRWENKSWIRSKPVREGRFDGLPFPKSLVPITHHVELTGSRQMQEIILAYRLLAHLKFTTVLELAHINPVCSELARGMGPVALDERQKNDALKIYCDEGGHAYFVDKLAQELLDSYGLDGTIVGRPNFDSQLDSLSKRYGSKLPLPLLRVFFVTVSETLVSRILKDIPKDPTVATVVRNVIADHAADEGAHANYFRWYFVELWESLDRHKKALMSEVLPEFLWAFLSPDTELEKRVLTHLGINKEHVAGIMAETYTPGVVAKEVRVAARPTLELFDRAGVFASPIHRQNFADRLLVD